MDDESDDVTGFLAVADPPPMVPLTDDTRSRRVEDQFASRRAATRLWAAIVLSLAAGPR